MDELALGRFLQHQSSWYQTPRYWRAAGVMELDTPESGPRRHRVTLVGQGIGRAKLTVHGPFQQIVGELWLDEKHIHLVNKQQNEVWQTAATSAGLYRLAQVRLRPEQLLQVVLALAPQSNVPQGEGEGEWLALGEEKVRLDGQGRLLERTGGSGDAPYKITYQWSSHDAPMPARVHLAMGESHHMDFVWQEWRFPDQKSGEEMMLFTPPETFRWLYFPEYGEPYALP